MLGVDVDPQLGPGAQHVLEQGNGLAGDPRRAHGGVRQSSDVAPHIGHPIEAVVVKGEEHAVGGAVDVGLHVPVAHGDRGRESGHGVLGLLSRATPVGDGNGPWPVEERPARRAHMEAPPTEPVIPGSGARPGDFWDAAPAA